MEWTRIDPERHLPRIAEFFNAVWNRRDDSVLGRFSRHASHDGYIGYMIEDGDGIVGFAYGYRSAPGQFFNGLVKGFLDAQVYDEWMSDCFEIPELAVRADMRRRGYGTALLARLLDETDAKTAVLATQADNKPARGLYERAGWQVIHEPYYPFGPDQPFVLLGKKLPAAG
jgi:ribosomal protein S18 acetylase RimI-like enzyme